MARRIVPWTFWGGVLLVAVLAGADRVHGARPAPAVPDLRGAWDGFTLDADATAVGLVRTNLTAQARRVLAGQAVLRTLDGGVVFNLPRFRATLAEDDLVVGDGQGGMGQATFRADLTLFAGARGPAGIMQAEYELRPVRGPAARIDGLLLHPFPDAHGPRIVGVGTGRLVSQSNPSFRGDLRVEFEPRERGAYPGRFTFQLDADEEGGFTWPLRATTSDNGRLVMIAQGKTGRAIYDGVVIPRADGTFFGGVYRLLFNDGRSNYGAYNFTFTAIGR